MKRTLLKYTAIIGIYTFMYLVIEKDFGKRQIETIRRKKK